MDYSAAAVEVAKRLWKARRRLSCQSDHDDIELEGTGGRDLVPEGGGGCMDFWVHDMLRPQRDHRAVMHPPADPRPGRREPFDLVVDKGTLDAVSLSPEAATSLPKFRTNLIDCMRLDRGFLLITSCNWTESELRHFFEHHHDESEAEGMKKLEFHASIPYPTFTFGGEKGQSVSSVCFRRVQ